MLADLESLDATIIHFNPDYKVETIRFKELSLQGLGKSGTNELGCVEYSEASGGASEQPRYCPGNACYARIR
jgi:hypothetical protein